MLNHDEVLEKLHDSGYLVTLKSFESEECILKLESSDLAKLGLHTNENCYLLAVYKPGIDETHQKDRFDFYEVDHDNEIGSGTESRVIRAKDLATGKNIAVKIKSEGVPEGWKLAYRRLNAHPNFVKTHAIGFIYTPVEKENLSLLISSKIAVQISDEIEGAIIPLNVEGRALTWTETQARQFINSFLDAQEALLENGIDNFNYGTFENILIDPNNKPVFCDFDSLRQATTSRHNGSTYEYAAEALIYIYYGVRRYDNTKALSTKMEKIAKDLRRKLLKPQHANIERCAVNRLFAEATKEFEQQKEAVLTQKIAEMMSFNPSLQAKCAHLKEEITAGAARFLYDSLFKSDPLLNPISPRTLCNFLQAPGLEIKIHNEEFVSNYYSPNENTLYIRPFNIQLPRTSREPSYPENPLFEALSPLHQDNLIYSITEVAGRTILKTYYQPALPTSSTWREKTIAFLMQFISGNFKRVVEEGTWLSRNTANLISRLHSYDIKRWSDSDLIASVLSFSAILGPEGVEAASKLLFLDVRQFRFDIAGKSLLENAVDTQDIKLARALLNLDKSPISDPKLIETVSKTEDTELLKLFVDSGRIELPMVMDSCTADTFSTTHLKDVAAARALDPVQNSFQSSDGISEQVQPEPTVQTSGASSRYSRGPWHHLLNFGMGMYHSLKPMQKPAPAASTGVHFKPPATTKKQTSAMESGLVEPPKEPTCRAEDQPRNRGFKPPQTTWHNQLFFWLTIGASVEKYMPWHKLREISTAEREMLETVKEELVTQQKQFDTQTTWLKKQKVLELRGEEVTQISKELTLLRNAIYKIILFNKSSTLMLKDIQCRLTSVKNKNKVLIAGREGLSLGKIVRQIANKTYAFVTGEKAQSPTPAQIEKVRKKTMKKIGILRNRLERRAAKAGRDLTLVVGGQTLALADTLVLKPVSSSESLTFSSKDPILFGFDSMRQRQDTFNLVSGYLVHQQQSAESYSKYEKLYL